MLLLFNIIHMGGKVELLALKIIFMNAELDAKK